MNRLVLLCLSLALFPLLSQAQISLPNVSQKCVLTQTIGLTEVSVMYHRPQVKEREVWGKMVPVFSTDKLEKGQIPWRAGANQNTVISFSTDVKIEGKSLSAGSYGLHMIPTKDKWTIAFSSNSSSWGSYSYNQKEDVLRVQVSPVSTHHHEFLTYDVIDQTKESGTIVLNWEKKQIPIKMTTATHDIVLASMKDQLRSTAGFSWNGWNTAAQYCLQNGIDLEQGLAWSDQAIGRGGSFTALSTKAGILTKLDRAEEAEQIMGNAMNIATNAELNIYGYTLLNQGKMDKAIEVFQLNVDKHPKDPNAWDSLGEGYANREQKGDKKLAIKAFEKSLSMNPPANVRANSMKYLKQMEVKKYMDDVETAKADK
ncbi:MAG: DUF2911 domain-containing protein [Bacteroidota bacterium]